MGRIIQKVILVCCFVFGAFATRAQSDISITENGIVQEYLAAESGLISAVKVLTSNAETKTLRFGTQMAKEMMEFFPKDTEVRFTYTTMTRGELLYSTFNLARRFPSLTNNGGFLRFAKISLAEETKAMKGMSARQKRNLPIKFLVGITAGDKGLIIPEGQNLDKKIPRTHELLTNIEVVKTERLNKFNLKITLKNGRSFTIKKYEKSRLSKTKALKVIYPTMYEGEVHIDGAFITMPEKVHLLQENQVKLDKPIYDVWSRLIAYQTTSDDSNNIYSFSTTDGKTMKALKEDAINGTVKIYTSVGTKTAIKVDNMQNYSALSYRIEAIESGDKIISLLAQSPKDYEYDSLVTFSSKVMEISNTIMPELILYDPFNEHIFLENNYVFNLSKKVMDSFAQPLKIGMEISITGRPFRKKPGEVLKKENFNMIAVNSITINNITYNLNIR